MKIWGAAIALSMMFAAIPAKAAEYIATFSGTTTTFLDPFGFFGTPGQAHAGSDFTLVYYLTYPLAGTHVSMNSNSMSVHGGSVRSSPAPVQAIFTLNGISRAISGAYEGLAIKANNHPSFGDLLQFVATTRVGECCAESTVSTVFTGSNLFDNFDLQREFQSGTGGSGTGFILYAEESGGLTRGAAGQLSFSSVSYIAAAVPEPASWFMMVLGVGLIGASLRRRSVKALAAQ